MLRQPHHLRQRSFRHEPDVANAAPFAAFAPIVPALGCPLDLREPALARPAAIPAVLATDNRPLADVPTPTSAAQA
jgi:hypothetical protein